MEPYPVWKHATRLADGREIIYFDESPGLGREKVRDSRDLGGIVDYTAGPVSQLRWDPLAGEWVIIAQQRQDRTFLPPVEACPLCPSAPGRPTEIPASSYDVVVFENRFPSLAGAGHMAAEPAAAALRAPPVQEPPVQEPPVQEPSPYAPSVEQEPGGLSAQHPGYGRCEVVCFTADHEASFADLTPRRARTVVEAWADRTVAIGAFDGVEQVFCFENRGEEIGVTLHHPHGQIYGYPFVTPRTARMIGQARRYAARTGGNLFDDMIASELAAGTRLVSGNDHWAAFVPAAARWPYEVLLFPSQRVPDLSQLSDVARDAFCTIYLDVLRRFDALFNSRAPYIAALHQAPVAPMGGPREDFALHLQLMSVRRAPGRLKYLAGSESGMGVWINDIVPETAARRLREAL